jgi:hypothetical protein
MQCLTKVVGGPGANHLVAALHQHDFEIEIYVVF